MTIRAVSEPVALFPLLFNLCHSANSDCSRESLPVTRDGIELKKSYNDEVAATSVVIGDAVDDAVDEATASAITRVQNSFCHVCAVKSSMLF